MIYDTPRRVLHAENAAQFRIEFAGRKLRRRKANIIVIVTDQQNEVRKPRSSFYILAPVECLRTRLKLAFQERYPSSLRSPYIVPAFPLSRFLRRTPNMGTAAEMARKYLQEKQIPALFETMMTGLMYNKPEDPVDFMLRALHSIRRNPSQKVTWDLFVENPPPPIDAPPSRPGSSRKLMETRLSAANQDTVRRTPPPRSAENATKPPSAAPSRPSSVLIRSKAETIDLDRPLVLLLGGPGGGKTEIAERVCEIMDDPVGHIVMSKAIKRAINKYDAHPEWKEAASKLESGSAIDDSLALAILKSEIASLKDDNSIILLEGYPKDLNQAAEFEREIKRVDKAVIIDFDEDKLRSQMVNAGLSESVIESRLSEYKNKTLPTAKYFDDRLILQLIPGEQDTDTICDQLKNILVNVLYPPAAPDPVRIETELNQSANVDNETIDRGLSKRANVVLVVGAPGSLKSEYCKRIAQQFDGFVHLSMGALLREGVKQNPDDEIWKDFHERMKNGEHVPTELSRDVIYEAMAENSTAFGFVIEGYPRDVAQAQDFEKTIDRIDLVLLIDCTEQFCTNTLRQRSELAEDEKRSDDSPQAIKLRISNFKQHTLPMLKYFDEKGKLRVVEGDKGVDAVYEEVSKMVEEIFIPQESSEGKSLESSKNSK